MELTLASQLQHLVVFIALCMVHSASALCHYRGVCCGGTDYKKNSDWENQADISNLFFFPRTF